MYRILFLSAALVLCVSSAPHHGHDHHGAPVLAAKGPAEELDASSPEVLARLKRALETAKFGNAEVMKIVKATAQKVEGLAYTVEFDASNNEHCVASWAEEPWVSPDPEHVTVICQ